MKTIKEVQFLRDPVSVDVDNNIAHSAFKFSQDTNSIGTFNPNGHNENTVDDDEDLAVPGNDSGNMSKITGTATEISSSTQVTEFNAAYHCMKNMMIGLEHLICIDGSQTRNDSNVDRTPLISVQTLPPTESTGST